MEVRASFQVLSLQANDARERRLTRTDGSLLLQVTSGVGICCGIARDESAVCWSSEDDADGGRQAAEGLHCFCREALAGDLLQQRVPQGIIANLTVEVNQSRSKSTLCFQRGRRSSLSLSLEAGTAPKKRTRVPNACKWRPWFKALPPGSIFTLSASTSESSALNPFHRCPFFKRESPSCQVLRAEGDLFQIPLKTSSSQFLGTSSRISLSKPGRGYRKLAASQDTAPVRVHPLPVHGPCSRLPRPRLVLTLNLSTIPPLLPAHPSLVAPFAPSRSLRSPLPRSETPDKNPTSENRLGKNKTT